MNLPDVNVLIQAHRIDGTMHGCAEAWLRREAESGRTIALWDVMLVSVYRIVTSPGLFAPPTPQREALAFLDDLRTADWARLLQPSPSFWHTFEDTLRSSRCIGKLTTDAMIAAFAIEQGCTLVTFDRDFARFPGLRWTSPTIT